MVIYSSLTSRDIRSFLRYLDLCYMQTHNLLLQDINLFLENQEIINSKILSCHISPTVVMYNVDLIE